jgi:hypothetical protein
MKFHKSVLRMIVLGCFVLITNCQGKNAPSEDLENPQQEESSKAPTTGPQAAAPVAKCDDGQPVKVISGECSGMWSVKKAESGYNCEFEWKPTVRCPAGMKALGLQAACYGVTIRPADANTKTAEQCIAAHGKHPISPSYKLECCP